MNTQSLYEKYEPFWKCTHTCDWSKEIPICTCLPEKRIHSIQHALASLIIDSELRTAMLTELRKINTPK